MIMAVLVVYIEMKAFFTILQPQLALDYTLLASLSKINNQAKNRQAFQFFSGSVEEDFRKKFDL